MDGRWFRLGDHGRYPVWSIGDSDMNLETTQGPDIPPMKVRLSTLFTLTGVLAVYFAICAASGGMAKYFIAGALMIFLRLPLVFHARHFWISIPSLLLFLAIPITLEWKTLSYEWTTLKRPQPLSSWLAWSALYISYPVFALVADSQYNYSTTKKRCPRIVADAILLFGWIFICVAILLGMSHKN